MMTEIDIFGIGPFYATAKGQATQIFVLVPSDHEHLACYEFLSVGQ